MAVMIPDINPRIIENEGEKAFYTAALKLPNEYIVFYFFKYLIVKRLRGYQMSGRQIL